MENLKKLVQNEHPHNWVIVLRSGIPITDLEKLSSIQQDIKIQVVPDDVEVEIQGVSYPIEEISIGTVGYIQTKE